MIKALPTLMGDKAFIMFMLLLEYSFLWRDRDGQVHTFDKAAFLPNKCSVHEVTANSDQQQLSLWECTSSIQFQHYRVLCNV